MLNATTGIQKGIEVLTRDIRQEKLRNKKLELERQIISCCKSHDFTYSGTKIFIKETIRTHMKICSLDSVHPAVASGDHRLNLPGILLIPCAQWQWGRPWISLPGVFLYLHSVVEAVGNPSHLLACSEELGYELTQGSGVQHRWWQVGT